MKEKMDNGVIKTIDAEIEKKENTVEMTGGNVIKTFFSNISAWWKSTGFYIWWEDIFNFFRFRKEIREEKKDKNSFFNKLNLKTNTIGNVVYAQYNFSDNDLMWADYDSQKMCMRKFKEIAEYFTDKIMWGEYVIGDVMNFTTESGEPTMSYMYMFKYEPMLFSWKGVFKWIGIMIGIALVIAGIIVGCIFAYNL